VTIDLSRFHQAFFEEAEEHLGNLETLLLEIDVDDPDFEVLNAIFRAAHSIKGSSGTFGFTDLQDVTHILEDLLDRIRKGELPLRSEMVDAFLASNDLLKTMLSAHRGGPAADAAAIAGVCERLRNLTIGMSQDGVTDDSFGLFDDGPGLPVAGVSARTTDTESSPPVDDSYGFFVATTELPAAENDVPHTTAESHIAVPHAGHSIPPASTPAAAGPVAAIAAGTEGDGFGFFVDAPTPGADKPAAVTPIKTPSVTEPAALAADKPARERKAAPAAAAADTSIRVGVDKVDQLINLVGELVITQAMLAQSATDVDPVVFERLHTGLTQLERNTRDLQETVMSIRMMPMSVVFSRFPRVIRDLSQKLGKKVELKTSGETTELDKSLIERITDPLTHLIRNSLDHGIEMPADRLANGKQEVGTITLKAYQQSGNIVIEVGDDGAGLNRSKILGKAKERGLPVSDSMSDHDVWQLIFEAGFSTAEQITEVSGRGVGMDVVKRNITAMGGRVEIDSMTGVGTRMTVKLPLTLAILDGMSVAAGKETYIIPLGYVIESLQAEKGMIKSVSGVERLIQVRGEYLPVIALYELFGIPSAINRLDQGIMVIVEADGVKAAMFVDALVGQHQVVIKSLEANCRVGSADYPRTAESGMNTARAYMSKTAPQLEDCHTQEYLTFTLGSEEYAIDILKVQEIRGYENPTTIANSPSFIKGVINLRGTIVPIVDMRIKFNVGQVEYTPFTVVIILNIAGRVVGIVVDSVSDVTMLRQDQIHPAPEFAATVDTKYINGLGNLGERMLIVVDIEKLMISSEMALVDDAVAA
jgi:two-component system chemotaxis sensor kinase CheA